MKRREHVIEYRHQLGMQVKKLRKEQKLTQTQLGLMVGLDRSYISRIERGKCSTSFDNIIVLANGFGISPSELLLGIGEPTTFESPLPIAITVPPEREGKRYHFSEIQ